MRTRIGVMLKHNDTLRRKLDEVKRQAAESREFIAPLDSSRKEKPPVPQPQPRASYINSYPPQFLPTFATGTYGGNI